LIFSRESIWPLAFHSRVKARPGSILAERARVAAPEFCSRNSTAGQVSDFLLPKRVSRAPPLTLGFARTPPCADFVSVEARTAAAGPVLVVFELARVCLPSPAARRSQQFGCLPKRRRRGKLTIFLLVLSCVFVCRRAGPVPFVQALGFRAATSVLFNRAAGFPN
jgi:hypothetical protein